jgi:hypothetical protein
MSVPDLLTYDIVPPRRPSLDDLGGVGFLDDQVYPPDAITMPHAKEMNQAHRQELAAHSVIPVLVLDIQFSAGTPSLAAFKCCSTIPVTGTFTFVDNGTGDTSITWPANTFPTPAYRPHGGITGATIGQISVEAIANGVRVRTANSAGAATDLHCVVYYG